MCSRSSPGHDARDVGRRRTIGDETAVAEDGRVVERGTHRRLVLVVDDHRLRHRPEQDQRHAVAADAGRVGLDDTEREADGDRGVDDVAAAREDRGAGFGGERMTGDDDGARRRTHFRLDERLLRHEVVEDGLRDCPARDALAARARSRLASWRQPSAAGPVS